MNINQKKQKLNKGIGIAVAILLALTLCITIIAFTVSKRSKKPSVPTTSPTKITTNAPSTTNGNVEPSEQTGKDEPSFISPLEKCSIVKEYSADIPVFSLTMEDYRVHCGIDIGADVGTEVLAAESGTVTKVVYDPMMGQTVEITHSGGYVTVYKNLRTDVPEKIKEGAKVTVGDTIGYVGDTALIEISEKPHLHFEMYKDEKNIDPLSVIKITKTDETSDYED